MLCRIALLTAIQPPTASHYRRLVERLPSTETLLNDARLELRRESWATLVVCAMEAHAGPFGVQVEAENVLRSIDAEEYNQRALVATRAFDAGTSADIPSRLCAGSH